MSTLPLVAPEYREAANLIPVFNLQTQAINEIRAALLQAYAMRYGSPELVEKEEVLFAGAAGDPEVRALLYRPVGTGHRVPAILHIHGAGWIAGSADMMASFCADLAARHHTVVLSVDYRLAPEIVFPGAHDDCYAALLWLHNNATLLNIDPSRIAVLGDSAGGNLAAGIALRARDEGIPLKAQFLIYPALDDRTGSEGAPVQNASTGEFVVTREYMRQLHGAAIGTGVLTPTQRTYLAPVQAKDLASVASTFLAVGSLDLFLDEDCEYTLRLSRASVSVELHVYRGVFHGFDLIPSMITERFTSDLNLAIGELLIPTQGEMARLKS